MHKPQAALKLIHQQQQKLTTPKRWNAPHVHFPIKNKHIFFNHHILTKAITEVLKSAQFSWTKCLSTKISHPVLGIGNEAEIPVPPFHIWLYTLMCANLHVCYIHRLYLYTCTFVVRTWLLVCIRYKYKSWNYKHHQSQFHSPPWIKAMEALFYLSKVRMFGWVVSRGGGGLLGRIVLLLTWQFPEGASLGQEREQIQRVCWYSFIVFDILLHVWYLYSVL